MISFIVIGRNEGWKLSNCLNSIKSACEYSELPYYEIIYVDSKSDDDSISLAKENEKIKVIELTGAIGSSIARNVGADNSTQPILFFIDGDMELDKENLKKIFDNNLQLKYNFISGDFENYYYEDYKSRNVISKEMYHKNKVITKNFTTGGLFAINRELWESVGGMKVICRKGEDMDLGLRLSKKGVFMYRLPIKLVIHHTVSYRSSSRLWGQLKDDSHLYARSLLYRNNFFNINTFKLMIKQDYTLVALALSILLIILTQKVYFIIIYFFAVVFRSLLRKNYQYLYYYMYRDIKVFLGFFLFFPKVGEISYKKV